jgi:hypothetical protein
MPSKKPGAKKVSKKKAIKRIGKKATRLLPGIRSVGGRPTLLTDAKIKAIAHHIELGNFAVTACTLEDISERTFYHWLNVGQQDEQAGKDTLHSRFLQSIKKASAIAESANVQIALKGGPGWAAQMTWLERRFPDRWGHQSKLSMEEARMFVHRVIGALAMHISDREVLGKIVHEVSGVQVETNERIHTA